MTDRDDRVSGGQRVVGQGQLTQVCLLAQRGPGQLEHGGGRVGGDDPVAGGQQVPGQGPGAAADLDDEPASHRGQQVQQARCAAVGVLAEAAGVHQGQVVLVVLHGVPFSRPR